MTPFRCRMLSSLPWSRPVLAAAAAALILACGGSEKGPPPESPPPPPPPPPPAPPPPPPGPVDATITIDTTVRYQTMTGWEATAQLGQEVAGYTVWQQQVLDLAANSLGL